MCLSIMKQAAALVIILIINTALIAFSLQNEHCGERLIKIRGLIVGGKISQRGMWPWQVGIYKKEVSGWQFRCGGALVSSQWVLTAAHCFYVKKNTTNRFWFAQDMKPITKYKIKVGDHELRSYESSEQERKFQEIFVHPDYRHDPIYENDIALVKLNREVILGPYVRTVCLPGPDLDLAKPGTVGMVAGWGITESGYGSSFLRYSSFTIETNNVCDREINFYYNKTVAFCASDVKGHSAPCSGDSGGSMVRKVFLNGKYRFVTIGLVSWGGCKLGSNFGYYTRLQPFLPWICHKVNSTCIGPGQPTNGVVNSTKSIYQPNEIIRFTCNKNYTRIGKSELTCQRDGTWNGYKPICIEISCTNFHHPGDGRKRPQQSKFLPGEKIIIECKKGYTLLGKSSLICQSDGSWDRHWPYCSAPCPQLTQPKNGIQFGNNFAHGQTVRFKCNFSFKRIGSSVTTCINGKWNNQPPKCAAPCPDPGTPTDGHRYNHSFQHGDQVMFSCEKGMLLIGRKIITCNDGRWDQMTPTCLDVCTKPRHSLNGGVRPTRVFYYNGDEVSMYCDWNYKLIGDTRARCRNGKWSSKPPSCKRKCYSPGSPYNGWRNGRDFFEGKQVTFECNRGYDLVGLKTLECLDTGNWSGNVPTCKTVDCGGLPAPQHGEKIGETKTTYLGEVSFRCNRKGYQLKGSSRRVCQENGKWNGTLTKCEPVECQDPGKPDFGGRNPDLDKYVYESKIEYSCKANHTLKGDKHIICQHNKTWTGTKPTCLKNCQDAGDIPNGIITNNGFKHGDKISIRCKDGFRIKGSPELICNNGKWTNRKPKCVGVCAALGHPKNGQMLDFNFDYGSTVRFRCNYGFSLRGPEKMTCNNGKWNTKVPSCKENCLNPGRPTNGERKGDLFTHLQTVSFSCKKEFIMIGSSKITCIDGEWTDRIPDCTECGSPLGMENGKIPDKNIRASSRWGSRYDAKYARLHGPKAWCSGPFNKPPYLEIDLDKPYKITYIATQGSSIDNIWETKYTLSHTLAKSSYVDYWENDKEKVFNGNSDATTVVKHKLKKSFIARKVRFHPMGYRFSGYLFKTVCMRVEIYGCNLPTDCVMVGSRVLGRWGKNFNGGDYYYKSYVKTIDDTYDDVQLEIEDDGHHDDTFKTVSKTLVVLDVPNKQLNLPPGTRVLAPLNDKYYTGTITRKDINFYLVRLDLEKRFMWFRKSLVRVNKPTQFCEG